MKILLSSLALLVLMACSTWDEAGAQKQQAMEDASNSDQQGHIRNQNPGGRNF